MNPKIKKTDFGVYVMVTDTHLSRWVEQDRRLDHARGYIETFRRFIPEGGTVIDCGTSIGDHTVTYANIVGPNGRVLGFEANPDVAECCTLNLKIYPWAEIFNVGLSDSVGSSGILVSENVGASRLVNGDGISLAPLDDYTKNLKRCDFIKVDIEGYEPKMLDGAIETIKRFRPAILMEINYGCLSAQGFTKESVYSRLRALGYKWEMASGDESHLQYDILANFA